MHCSRLTHISTNTYTYCTHIDMTQSVGKGAIINTLILGRYISGFDYQFSDGYTVQIITVS